MKISKNWLQTYFDKPIPSADELANLFTFHSFEVEGSEDIETVEKTREGNEYKIKDTILDVKVLPDRAHYALSHRGVAGEVAALTNEPAIVRWLEKETKASVDTKPAIRIEAPNFCRRYMGRFVEIDKIQPASLWIRTALCSIGQRAISSIVDATNYVMFDVGQPLHAFDADKIVGAIVVRAAKKGETIELIDSSEGTDRQVELQETDHVIADDQGPIAIAGVKGGKRTGISDSTRRIIIESANFEPSAIRRTATRLDLRSEASKRYENEITPELATRGMVSVSALIKEASPNAKFGPIVDEYPVKAKQTIIEIDPAYINQRLGVDVPIEEIKEILENLEIKIESRKFIVESQEKGDSGLERSDWILTIPFERLDLTIPEDIVEEVGRIYGYDKIQGILPPKTDVPIAILPMFYLTEKIKNILTEVGFSEVNLYSLVAQGEIETAYPLAKDKAFARANLTDGMIACIDKNILNADLLGLSAIKIFEIGRVFTNDGEKTMLSIGFAHVKKTKGFDAGKAINDIVSDINLKLGTNLKDIEGQKSGAKVVFEIDMGTILASYKMRDGASYADLRFAAASPHKYARFSLYPFIVRDIALFVQSDASDKEVRRVISDAAQLAAGALLVKGPDLFDSFSKDGKTSYAFRLIFQSMDKTLSDAEANAFMEKVYEAVKMKGWQVR